MGVIIGLVQGMLTVMVLEVLVSDVVHVVTATVSGVFMSDFCGSFRGVLTVVVYDRLVVNVLHSVLLCSRLGEIM